MVLIIFKDITYLSLKIDGNIYESYVILDETGRVIDSIYIANYSPATYVIEIQL